MKVVLTDQVFPSTDVEQEILQRAGVTLEVLDDPSPESIAARARDADGLLNTYAPIDARLLESLPRCRVIARYGIGVDNIDLEAARRRGVVVTNVPDYCIEEVADHTMALILAALRKVIKGNEIVRSGGWGIAELRPIHRLRGRTLGIVGFGHIGRALAARAAAFGLKVAVHDPYVEQEAVIRLGATSHPALFELLGRADVVSVHVPLVEATRGLIGRKALDAMKPGAVLVNTSRGPVVDTPAVVEALESGHLAAAALDVFDREPPDPDLVARAPGLIATPHSAFYSEEAIRESQTKAATCVVDVLRGREPSYRVV